MEVNMYYARISFYEKTGNKAGLTKWVNISPRGGCKTYAEAIELLKSTTDLGSDKVITGNCVLHKNKIGKVTVEHTERFDG
jgi:hypothetical protein